MYLSRATWWDHLLQIYTVRINPTPHSNSPGSLSISRHKTALEISRDVCGFSKIAMVYLYFINIPLFFDTLHRMEQWASIQPYIGIGHRGVLQSNRGMLRDDEDKAERERMWRRSVALRDMAQAPFDASHRAGGIDVPLVQAVWVLVLYEVSAHETHTAGRKESAMIILALRHLRPIASRPSPCVTKKPAHPILHHIPGLYHLSLHPQPLSMIRYQAVPPSPTPFNIFHQSEKLDHSPSSLNFGKRQ
ncbi:hypothetical protein FRB95_004050 [Tulasnella sp. JGI-2019a]|nr:hypothetical protein FRB93_002035 [Tulasnella sp. JGI-2019a]KAG9037764.1 hypothetical protein FRB95_004050 [Tulasnella sp. JGI-2019a]